MDNGRAGVLGDVFRILVREKFTLAVDYIRFPVDQFPDQSVAERGGHPDVGIDHTKGNGADIRDCTVGVAVDAVRQSENPNVVAVCLQFLPQIADGRDNAVGFRGKQVGGDQNFHEIPRLKRAAHPPVRSSVRWFPGSFPDGTNYT